MLHWSTDPKLLDEQPTPPPHWETANSLIEKRGLASVIRQEDLSFTNLYGMMVRKIDFVWEKKSDRILARFPFLVMTDEMIEVIQSKELLLAEAVRDYFYKSVNKSILEWRERIRAFLDRRALPFPIYRVAEEILTKNSTSAEDFPTHSCKGTIPFTSARGEPFSFPAQLTRQLAYLCGVCNGDGNLREYWVVVVDESRKHIAFISNLLETIFSKESKISKHYNAWTTTLTLLWAMRLFNFLTDQTINAPKYAALREPVIFKRIGKPFRNLYWRGVMDADGSYIKQISFCTMSETLARDFQQYLDSLNISSQISFMANGGFMVNISAKDKITYGERIGSSHPKKLIDFLAFLAQRTAIINFQGIKQKTLTKAGFFNFSLLPSSIAITGLADFLKEYRETKEKEGRNFNSTYLGISPISFKNYEKGINAIPIAKLQRIIQDQFGTTVDMMTVLSALKKIQFTSSNSPPVSLPLQPSPLLIKIIKQVLPRRDWVYIALSNETTIDMEFRKKIEQLFSVKIKKNRIVSKVLVNYLRTFGDYQKRTILVKNKEKMKEKWKKQLA